MLFHIFDKRDGKKLLLMKRQSKYRTTVKASCMVAISSYPNSLYDDWLSGWRYIDFQAQTRHGVATERLYMNYDEPEELHDYSYLGTDYKDRERIKLKFDRWVANFEALPVQEQNMRIDYLNSTKFKTA